MQQLQEYLDHLIAFPSVTSDVNALSKALDWVESVLKQAGLSVSRHESGGFPSLVACTNGDSKKTKVLLQAHIDVVDGRQDQFVLKEVDGKYFGRGVLDMKFAIACYLAFFDEIQNHDSYDLAIMITSDEEIGGEHGVKYLMEQGYRADVCVLPDGGFNWNIDVAARGVWRLKLAAGGEAAHASRPWQGDNAITRLMKAATHLQLSASNQADDSASVSLTTFSSNKSINMIPDHAECNFDIRFETEEDYEEIQAKVDDLCKTFSVQQETIILDNSFSVESSNSYLRDYERLIEKYTGHKPKMQRSFGSSDARFLSAKGIPVIVSSLVGGNHHSDDEWIDKESLETFYKILKEFVDTWSHNDSKGFYMKTGRK